MPGNRASFFHSPAAILLCVALVGLTAAHGFTLLNSGNDVHGDIALYQRVTEFIWQGRMPYRDFEFEYPPYAILFFLVPGLMPTLREFQVAFGLQILAMDILIKAVLIGLGWRYWGKASGLLPAVLFALATAANHHIYLQRFDLVPSAISVALLLAFCSKRFFLAGALVSFGTGCKLYPALFLLPLLLLAWHERKARSFATGAIAGILPLVALGFSMPWWRFLVFHAERGLQAESFYASLLWLGSLLGLTEARWIWVKAWFEAESPWNYILIPVAKAAFIAAVFYSVAFACWRSATRPVRGPAFVARLLLVPLVAFIAFNIVLSPQYLFWVAGLAAVAILDGRLTGPLLLIGASLITPLFYPSQNYGTRLNSIETLALFARNMLLIGALVSIVAELRGKHVGAMRDTEHALPTEAAS